MEIYYYANSPSADFLAKKLKETGEKSIFIDLLPHFYKNIGVTPYNFVFQYGNNPSLPPSDFSRYKLRGIRPEMDWPNTKLKAIYYVKTAFANLGNPQIVKESFAKVRKEAPFYPTINNLVNEFESGKYGTGMF